MRASQPARGRAPAASSRSASGAGSPRPVCQSLSGRPVACTTSQARTWRWRSPGFSRADDRRIALGQPRAEGLGAHRVASRHWPASRTLGRHSREWRQCPASGSADRGPSRRTGSASGRPRRARSRPPPDRASARPTASRRAAARRRARCGTRARSSRRGLRRQDREGVVGLHGVGIDHRAAARARPARAPAPTCRWRSVR